MTRRTPRPEALALLDAYTAEELGAAGLDPKAGSWPAAKVARAVEAAHARLNRAARRALGARSDGRFHPAATLKTIPRKVRP